MTGWCNVVERQTSVIVVTYNSEEYIEACLESVMRNNPLEVIIVDNCSSDGTAGFVANHFPGVKVIRNRANTGYGAGNNLGVSHAKGEYVVILNPDTTLHSGAVRELLFPLAGSDINVITTPKILMQDGCKINTCGNINHFTGLTYVRGLNEDPGEHAVSSFVSGISGCCFAIRKRDFEDLGGFDERFFYYNEDSDLSWRALLKGFKILFVHSSVIIHHYKLSISPNKLYHLEKGRYAVLRKHFTWKDFAVFLPSLVIAEIITFGYAMKLGWGGVYYKTRALIDGLMGNWQKVEGDRQNLFNYLETEIPVDPFSANNFERFLMVLANMVFRCNFRTRFRQVAAGRR